MKLNIATLALICLFQQIVLHEVSAEDLFPDKGLEAAVRQQVYAKRNNAEPLVAEDVKRISTVNGKGKAIKSLVGLEHCVAIQELVLENNEITDLSALKELKLLQSINLAGNKIESLDPLKELERVQYLELSRNQISDVSPLANMKNMRSLYLSGNKLEKIDTLKELRKVWSLYLAGNPLQDFSPIEQMTSLSSLDLSNCGVADLQFLSSLKPHSLTLSDNKISDLSPLLEMAKNDADHLFAPFWRIDLKGNPVDAKSETVEELRKLGAKLKFE
jgi:internalin A